MNKKILLLLIVLVLLADKSSALGVSPGVTFIDFEPNLERTVNLRVLNNEQKDLSVAINTEGELSKYISLSEKDIQLSPSEGEKTTGYTVKLPESIGRPGIHEANIVLREAKSVTGGGINIGATVSVISILRIRVPYQGKYAEATLFAMESDQKDEVMLIAVVTNFGEENIEKAVASIDIFSADKKVATVTTDEKLIEQGNKRELIAKWKAIPGEYKAKAKINYDGKIAEAETGFKTEGFFIKVIDISVKNFKLGGIAKFQILLESIANKKSENVFTKMILNDQTGKQIMDVESQRETFQPQERKELQAYWDTEKVEKGEYSGKVAVQADEEKWETMMSMDVEEDRITTRIGPTAMAVAETKTGYKTTPLIGILIIALIAVNIGWYVYFKKKKKSSAKT